MMGWIGVDLDGTLANYSHWEGEEHIGAPVPAMVSRVKAWLNAGEDVRIFTARVANGPAQLEHIKRWCLEHLGRILPITNVKDFGMAILWDDRCVQVGMNTGRRVGEEGVMSDEIINHPAHYTRGKFEVIDVIEDWNLDWHLGNVVKYVGRYGHKGSDLGDLKKARWYLNRKIQVMEGTQNENLDGDGRNERAG